MQLTMAAGQLGNIGKLESFMKASNSRMTNLINTITRAHREILNITIFLEQRDLITYDVQRAILALVPSLFTKRQFVMRLERKLETL